LIRLWNECIQYVYITDLEGFTRLLKHLQISVQMDAVRRLFTALTLNRSDGKVFCCMTNDYHAVWLVEI